MKLWITGRNPLPDQWEVLGIYDTEGKAIDRCKQSCDFVAPAELNQDMEEERITWEGCYYPLITEESK